MQTISLGSRRVMYQVEVTTLEGKHKRVGPITNQRDMPEQLCQAINVAVADGKERNWHDARVIEVHHMKEPA